MNKFHFFLFVAALLLLNTSIEVVAIRIENVSTKSLKIIEIFLSLAELRVSKNFQSSLHEVPSGTSPSHNISPPNSKTRKLSTLKS